MGVYFYITSMAIALISGVVNIIKAFSDEDAIVFKAFGDAEMMFLLGVSIVLIAIGLLCDKGDN